MENEIKYTWVPFFEELLDKICKTSDSAALYKSFKSFSSGKWDDIDKIDPLSYICCINGGSVVFHERCKIAKETFNLESEIPKDNKAIPAFPTGNFIYIHEFYKNKPLDEVVDALWNFATKVNNSNVDENSFNKIVQFNNIGVGKLSQFMYICKPNEYYSCDGTMLSFFSHKLSGKDYNAFQEVQSKGKATGLSPYVLSMQAWDQKEKNNQESINSLRDELLLYGKELGAITSETGSYTALKTIKNIAEIHKVTEKSKKFRVLVSYEVLDDDLKKTTEKVPDSYLWTLNGSFYVDSKETLEQAKKLVKNAIEMTRNDTSPNKFINEEIKMTKTEKPNKIPLNQILYGPPGTGKTYKTKDIIWDIIKNNDEFKQWVKVAYVIYKEFKGKAFAHKDLKTLVDLQILSDAKDADGKVAACIARMQEHTSPENKILTNEVKRQEPYLFEQLEDKSWRLNKNGIKFIEAIKDKYCKFITFHQSYSYEEFVEGIKPDLKNNELKYVEHTGIFKEICNDAKKDNNNYVLIIDEINRGNISKILGELITLIEDTKRIGNDDELQVTLPYTKEKFGVPKNLYIIGTMNTSDRSIASVDCALRRRFKFKEIMPDSKLVPDEIAGLNADFRKIFVKINQKICILLDREHQIGHSYFMKVKNIDELKAVWFDSIIPLLNEYFYGEWDKLRELIPTFINEIQTADLIKSSDLSEKYYYDFYKESDFNSAKMSFENVISNMYPKKTDKTENLEQKNELSDLEGTFSGS